jgi:hypothetical protein
VTDEPARDARRERRRALAGLAALFVAVHVGIPMLGAIAFRRAGDAALKGALAARTSDPWILGGLGGLVARDGTHYLAIASDGYRTPQSWAFFPLYPMAARALGPLVGGAPRAGLILALVASLGCCALLYRMTAASQGQGAAARAVALFLAFPTHFFFGAFYTEALFFAFVVSAMMAGANDRWVPAAVSGALAAATRSSGILLVPALAIASLHRRRWRTIDARLAWLALVPAATAAFFGAGFFATGQWAAPLAAQAAWGRKTTFPLLTIAQAAQDLRLHPLDLQRDVDVAAVLAGFVLAARSLRRVDAAQSVYFLLALLLPLSSGLVHSMARYLAGIPAVYLVLAQDLAPRRRFAAALTLSLAAQLWLAIRFCEGSGLA